MAGAKTKAISGKVYRVTRSHESRNEGELYRAVEDDYIKGRISAGLLREVTAEELTELEARGAVVVDVTSAQEDGDATSLDGANETRS